MTRLFLYRLFWATYDYLGSITLSGLGLLLSILALLSLFVFDVPGVSKLQSLSWGLVLGFLIFVWIVLGVHLVAQLGRTAAFEEKILWRQMLLPSVRQLRKALLLVLIAAFGILLFGANLLFYATLARQSAGVRGVVFLSLVILFFYLFLCFLSYLLALFGVWANSSEHVSLWDVIRQAFVSMLVLPRLWFFCLFLCLGGAVLAILTVLGLIFLIPLLGIIACVAAKMVEEYIENLRLARQELGEQHSLRHYQKHAQQLCLEAELRKGTRNLREIFKPWQY